MTVRVITLFFLVCVSPVAPADTLTGKVAKITDGDTLYVLDANYEQHKIRLAGIDAPERKQAHQSRLNGFHAAVIASLATLVSVSILVRI